MTRIRIVCAALVPILILRVPVRAQQTFRSRAEAVRVDVLVTDGTRRVRGLTAADFEVRDNGVLQQISQIEVERIPLTVIAVIDASDSVRGTRLQELVAAGHTLVDGLRDPDRAAIVAFATHVSVPVALTADHDRLRRALTELAADGLTSLRDAAFAGLAIRERDTSRTLMLVFSDGDDTSSFLTPSAVFDAAARSDVVVYAVTAPEPPQIVLNSVVDRRDGVLQEQHPIKPFWQASPDTRADGHAKFLVDLAASTGGSVTQVESDKNLAKTFTSILGEFRDRYVLSYLPTGVDQPGWHELSVRVKGKAVKVTARRGYLR